jgi:hypothetical protein
LALGWALSAGAAADQRRPPPLPPPPGRRGAAEAQRRGRSPWIAHLILAQLYHLLLPLGKLLAQFFNLVCRHHSGGALSFAAKHIINASAL